MIVTAQTSVIYTPEMQYTHDFNHDLLRFYSLPSRLSHSPPVGIQLYDVSRLKA